MAEMFQACVRGGVPLHSTPLRSTLLRSTHSTPLLDFCAGVAEVLLNLRCSPHRTNVVGLSAVHVAARDNAASVLQVFAESGVSMSRAATGGSAYRGATPLQIAEQCHAHAAADELVRLLPGEGGEPDGDDPTRQ